MDILYENDQWAIDNEGMICKLDNGHDVGIRELFALETWTSSEWDSGKQVYRMPMHYSGKRWADISCFLDAWVKALDIFNKDKSHAISAEVLERTIVLARKAKNDLSLVNSSDLSGQNFSIKLSV